VISVAFKTAPKKVNFSHVFQEQIHTSLAERLRKEGEIRGLNDAIELGMTLKFPDQVDPVMAQVKKIKDTIKTAKQVSEILLLTEKCE